MDVLEVRPKELHTIVLSHGHADHAHGLMGLVERLGERRMPPPDRRLLFHEGVGYRFPIHMPALQTGGSKTH